jgi:hypothetical protein
MKPCFPPTEVEKLGLVKAIGDTQDTVREREGGTLTTHTHTHVPRDFYTQKEKI